MSELISDSAPPPAEAASDVKSSWWRRNRIWLCALVPVLALAVAASSFRMVTLYLPWQWSRPIVAEGSSGTLTQSFQDLDDVRREREVTAEVLSVLDYPTLDGVRPVPGGTMWRVWLELSAEPDQHLDGCYIELTDAEGNRYDFSSGLESAEEDGFYLAPWILRCVPEDAPGPSVELFSNEVVESEIERPRTWRYEALIAMPDGVEPETVRIGWNQPVYLELEIP